MGRKMALAAKYVSRLIFALFSQTRRAFRALAMLGGWEQPYAEPPVRRPYDGEGGRNGELTIPCILSLSGLPGIPPWGGRVPSGWGQAA